MVSKILFAYHAQGDRFHPKYIGFKIIFNVKHFKSCIEYSVAQQNIIIVTCTCLSTSCNSQLHRKKSIGLFYPRTRRNMSLVSRTIKLR